jgi:integrase
MPPKRRHDGLPEGIYARHRKSCANAGQPDWSCGCPPSYQAQAWSRRDGRRPTRTFPRLREAVKWRNDARGAVQSGKVAGSRALTLRRASDDFMEAAEGKLVLNRSGRPYKPSVVRSYRTALELRVLPDYGVHPVIDLRRSDWQRLVTTLHRQGVAPSTIRNTFDPVRAIYRRLLSLEEVDVNPTRGLDFPVAEEARDRVAAPAEGSLLLTALSYPEKAIYATAMYAGMRRGELQAVEDSDVDLDANLIAVRYSWDQEAGRVAVKTKAGRRTLPIPRVLRPILLDHRMRRPWRGPVLRPRARRGIHPINDPQTRAGGVGLEGSTEYGAQRLADDMGHSPRRRPRADRAARMPAHVRFADDRRRYPGGAQPGRDRQAALHTHGPCLDHSDARPLWTPVPRLRGRGGRGARRVLRGTRMISSSSAFAAGR